MGGIGVDAHRFEAVFHPLVIELLGAELLERVVKNISKVRRF